MRIKTLALAGVLCACPWAAQAQTPPEAPLTLAQAWRQAREANPALRALQAQRAAIQGALEDARAPLYNNPAVSLEGTRRDAPRASQPAEHRREWSAGVFQTFEIAGQQGYRRDAAENALAAQQAEIVAKRSRLHAEVAQAFFKVLALQQRLDVELQAAKLFDDTAAAVHRRREAGEDTRLDANVALVEAERARNLSGQAREDLLDARADLFALLQWPAGNAPPVQGDLADRFGTRYTLEALLASTEAQARLQALAARQESAHARVQLERANRYPDVTVGLSTGREGSADARERLTTLSVSVPLPLFRRNAAAIGQAGTELAQVQIEKQAAARDLRAEVYTLHSRLQSLQARAERLRERVLPALADNQQLSIKSQRAGQIGLLELIVVNRQALDAQRDLIDVLSEYQSTRYALEAAAGWAEDEQGTTP